MMRSIYLALTIALLGVLISWFRSGKLRLGTAADKPVPGSGEFFDLVAPKYDLMNRIISLGLDKQWRRQAIESAMPATSILDVSTGTAELAITAAADPSVKVIGIDPSKEMLALGKLKLERAKDKFNNIELVTGKVEELPFESETFDAVIVAFGVRNFQDREKGLSEMKRVLKKGGRIVVLEASTSEDGGVLNKARQVFVRMIMPGIASLIAGDPSSYKYLSSSMELFPKPEKFMAILRDMGLMEVRHSKLSPFGLGPDLFTAKKQ